MHGKRAWQACVHGRHACMAGMRAWQACMASMRPPCMRPFFAIVHEQPRKERAVLAQPAAGAAARAAPAAHIHTCDSALALRNLEHLQPRLQHVQRADKRGGQRACA
eukprot:364943-Chlamydomonas_euryale.AAC.4